jgi:hypothetical protein
VDENSSGSCLVVKGSDNIHVERSGSTAPRDVKEILVLKHQAMKTYG